MKKSALSLAALVVLASSTLTASAQTTTQARGGCDPRPQIVVIVSTALSTLGL